ncbi:E3 ubiquitin/ISG15 ligase TRIM25 isoform X3 [Hypomesus transpacificus]|uniref:E3 ubiquitin/ISG15 ligase TRIM25 isoform X3 n=1 Tax=Hypomesus transpacificus TaxID=137520 RepID=UPI001F07AC6F|nr:E3 ubiquitin/ISG15 ligase TRIM25 isoform X3 [Hypomesus transpacificus]
MTQHLTAQLCYGSAMAEEMTSLMSLEDELTCSICLCPFDCPVTTPCGHNFCQDCLFTTWKENYSCPQCRTHFSTKPELKKNTVLSTVMETFKLRALRSDSSITVKETMKPEEPKPECVICDTCMLAKAVKTCLTCMASFCEDHVRPHKENPIFSTHQLCDPLGDLRERICTDHNKLMEFYCNQHRRCICSICLQQVHKGCQFSTPDEQRAFQESDMRNKLGMLDGKIEKNRNVISEMKSQQIRLKDTASSKKKVLEGEYQQIREMLDREEREALNTVDREQESGQTKLQGLMKKFDQNIDKMSGARDDINNLLSQSESLAFLQASVDLPSQATFDPYTPRVNLDSKAVAASQAFAAVLREHLSHLFNQPVEARLQKLRPELSMGMRGESTFVPPLISNPPPMFTDFRNPQTFPLSEHGRGPIFGRAEVTPRPPRSHSPGAALRAGQKKKPDKKTDSKDQRGDKTKKQPSQSTSTPKEHPKEPLKMPPNITSVAKRHDLLQYGTVLTLDGKTAHKRVCLSENFTVATVSDEPNAYPDCPARFSVCSQVLCTKGFSRGRHYWEVKMSSNNFVGLGLAYNSIDRKGPASRLGRNAQSWCVEWFNVKLSAWHASSETVLVNPNPSRVGVLLDCEEGTATFYNVADRATPFHSFVFPFAEAVYPAFWIFSNGSSVSLCKLQA